MTDKRYIVDRSTLTGIANAIRAKTGKTDTMEVDEMAREINRIDINRNGIRVNSVATTKNVFAGRTVANGIVSLPIGFITKGE